MFSKSRTVSVKFYLKELASALEQINLGLLVFGLCLCWSRKELWDWDRGALFLLGGVLAGGVWILYDHYGLLNGRYFFPIYLALMPYFGIGLLLVWNVLWVQARRWERTWLTPKSTAVFIVCLAIGLGWTDAFTTRYGVREREASLGAWLAETHGPFRGVATDLIASRTGYHAGNEAPKILHNWGTMEHQFPGETYDLLLLSYENTPPESRPLVEAAARRMGLEPIIIPKDHEARARLLAFARPRANPLACPQAGDGPCDVNPFPPGNDLAITKPQPGVLAENARSC